MHLPPAEEVEFIVGSWYDRQAHYNSDVNHEAHEIAISARWCGTYNTLLQLVAHEMIHMDQRIRKTESRTLHNAEYRKISRYVCRLFQWDLKPFITT